MAFAHVLLASARDGIAAPAGHVAIEIELSVVLVSGFWFRNRRLWLRGRRGIGAAVSQVRGGTE